MYKIFIKIGLVLTLIITLGGYSKAISGEFTANNQKELNNIIDNINSSKITDKFIKIKVNSYNQENYTKIENAYDLIFNQKDMDELSIPYISIEGFKGKNPFLVDNLNINSNKFPIIKVKNLAFSSNNFSDNKQTNINLNLNNSNGMIIFINNSIKNATGKVAFESDSISFFNNIIDSNSVNLMFNYKDNLIINENTFTSNNPTNSLININNKVNTSNLAAVGGNEFLYNFGNIIKAKSDKVLLVGNIAEENKTIKNLFINESNINANTVYAFEDQINGTSNGIIYNYISKTKGINLINLSDADMQIIEESLNTNKTPAQLFQRNNNDSDDDESQGGGVVGGLLQALNPITWVTNGISATTNVITSITTAATNTITSIINTTMTIVQNIITLAVNTVTAVIQIVMVPVGNALQALGFITSYNDYMSTIPTFEVGVSNSARTVNSYSFKTVNQTNISERGKNINYHFQDTRVGNFATDWLITFSITNSSDHDIIFNNMLITEYIGEGISQPVGSNQNQRMFEQGNRNLAVLLNQMYNTPAMREYLSSIPNLTDFLQSNLSGLVLDITPPDSKPSIQQILSGIGNGLVPLNGRTNPNTGNGEINIPEEPEGQPDVQQNRLMSFGNNSFINKSINQEDEDMEGDETQQTGNQFGLQDPNEPPVSLPQDNLAFISVENLIYTGDSETNGNFLVSTVNCQEPYYSPITSSGSILDLMPTMTQNISIPAGKTCEIQVMFKPKVAGYHRATIEIGSSSLPSQSEQVMSILMGSIGELLSGITAQLNDIKLYSGLGKIVINLDGWAYNEKNLLVDLNQDRQLDTFQVRFFDGIIENPLYNSPLSNPIAIAGTYGDQTPNIITNVLEPVDPAQVVDEHISILTDFDYWFMKPYFVDKYGKKGDKYRKFPKQFEPQYRFMFDINNIRSLNRIKFSNIISADFKKPIKIYIENANTGQFIELTPHVNIYTTDLASPIRPKGTGFDMLVEDGGFVDRDGITNGQISINPIWVGIKGKTLELNKGDLLEPDLDNLVPEIDNETRWGGLIVH